MNDSYRSQTCAVITWFQICRFRLYMKKALLVHGRNGLTSWRCMRNTAHTSRCIVCLWELSFLFDEVCFLGSEHWSSLNLVVVTQNVLASLLHGAMKTRWLVHCRCRPIVGRSHWKAWRVPGGARRSESHSFCYVTIVPKACTAQRVSLLLCCQRHKFPTKKKKFH